jgi:pantetheine-phosphate adenylyltransferase
MKTCVFAGTFDPVSRGHEFVINKCLELFDKVVVAIGVNVDKTPVFSLDERIALIRESIKSDRVEVTSFSGMLTDFMKDRGILYSVRGLRSVDDYKYEDTMAKYNLDMYPEMLTIYIPTPNELTYVSSTAIRNIISLESDISKYMPESALALAKKFIKAKKK